MIHQAYDMDELFRCYRTKIYWLALSIARNERDAEDILQNTFIKIIRNIHTFEGRSSLSTWIYRVTYNEALMFLRKRQRQGRLAHYLSEGVQKGGGEMFVSPAPMPDDSIVTRELEMRLHEAIRHMPIKYRMAVLVHNIEGMSVKETAGLMRMRLNALKTRLHRAYGIIRSEVSDYLLDKRSRAVRAQEAGCSGVRRFIFDYVQGSLPDERASRFRTVLRSSSAAQGFLDTYGPAIRLTRELECRDVPAELREKVEHVLAGTRTPRAEYPPAGIRVS